MGVLNATGGGGVNIMERISSDDYWGLLQRPCWGYYCKPSILPRIGGGFPAFGPETVGRKL